MSDLHTNEAVSAMSAGLDYWFSSRVEKRRLQMRAVVEIAIAKVLGFPRVWVCRRDMPS